LWALLYARNPRSIESKNTRSEVGLPTTLHSSTKSKTMAFLFPQMPNFDYTLFLILPLCQNGYTWNDIITLQIFMENIFKNATCWNQLWRQKLVLSFCQNGSHMKINDVSFLQIFWEYFLKFNSLKIARCWNQWWTENFGDFFIFFSK
jgi:hypothetical protein